MRSFRLFFFLSFPPSLQIFACLQQDKRNSKTGATVAALRQERSTGATVTARPPQTQPPQTQPPQTQPQTQPQPPPQQKRSGKGAGAATGAQGQPSSKLGSSRLVGKVKCVIFEKSGIFHGQIPGRFFWGAKCVNFQKSMIFMAQVKIFSQSAKSGYFFRARPKNSKPVVQV